MTPSAVTRIVPAACMEMLAGLLNVAFLFPTQSFELLRFAPEWADRLYNSVFLMLPNPDKPGFDFVCIGLFGGVATSGYLTWRSLWKSVIVSCLSLIPLPVGVYFYAPSFFYERVARIQGVGLYSEFTNFDLLLSCTSLVVLSSLVLARRKQ